MTCPFCGKADNPAHAKFCSHCGTALLPARAVEPGQPSHPNEPSQATQTSQAGGANPASQVSAAGPPARSRQGFYAGQVSHLDQVGPANTISHAPAPVHEDRTEQARQGTASSAPPLTHLAMGHFDERYGTGGRFVSRPADPPAPVEPPQHTPEPERQPAITPEMMFNFGQKEPAPAPEETTAAIEPRPVPPPGPSAPEPDPVSRSFGTWATPPAPTSRPDFVAAAQKAQDAQAVDAAGYSTSQLDLTTVRDLFPEPRLDATTADQPGTPVAAETSSAVGEPSAQAAGQRGPDVEHSRAADESGVAPHIAAATATRSQEAVGERRRSAEDLEQYATRVDQAESAGDAGSGHAGGPAGPTGPAGPVDAFSDTNSEPAGTAPLTKQSRYWATGAHASAFAGAWLGGVPAFVGPLVVWLARKDKDPFAAEHGRNALNFNLSVIVYVLGLIIVSIITFGVGLLVTIPGFIVLGLAWFAFTLVGTIKAASSESYTYPLTIRFVR